MQSAQELLTMLQKNGTESARIEAKELTWIADNSTAIYETICAFANEPQQGGGYILLGVTEGEDGAFEVSGVADADNIQNTLTSVCRGEKLEPPVYVECVAEKIDDKTVVVVYVPEATWPHYPIWYKGKKGTHVYRRRNGADIRCTQAEINALMRVKNNAPFDILPNKRASMDDLDVGSIARFRELLTAKQSEALVQGDDTYVLFALNCIEKEGENIYPTNAGILLFGTQLALLRYFPTFRVDYIMMSGFEWVDNADARYISKDTFQENLFTLADKLFTSVLGTLPARPVFQSHTVQRKDEPLLPARALREAIVNMLMHQDFQQGMPVQIRKYADRLELENPGYSLKPLEEKEQPRSVARNQAISSVFHRINYAEILGSGLKSMGNYMRDAGLKEPEFYSDKESNIFRCTFSLSNFLTEEEITWLRKFSQQLSENQIRALIEVRHKGKIDNATYCALNNLGANDKKARKELADLCKKGILVKHSKHRWTIYTLTSSIALLSPSLSPTEKQAQKQLQLPVVIDNNVHGDAAEEQLGTSSTALLSPPVSPTEGQALDDAQLSVIFDKNYNKCGAEEQLGTSSIAPLSPTLSPSLLHTEEQALDDAAQQALLGARKSEIMTRIVAECAKNPRTVKELALITQLSVRTLKASFLTPLLREKKLSFLYPDKPNHPQQAYIVPDSKSH